MAAEVAARLSAAALAHPAFDALRHCLAQLSDNPDVTGLNALAAAGSPQTASGHAIRFCSPDAAGEGHYEQRIFDTGLVETRPDNLHDLFNALVWLAFPRTKAALNARHVARLRVEGNRRGSLRDLLTLVDEGGVIVACVEEACAEIESLVRGFHWQALFWERRASLPNEVRFVLTGHNAYEKALSPYPGITCKALFVPTPRPLLAASAAELASWLDARGAAWVEALPEDASPRQMAPLPVFGYPGWLADSADAAFYSDRRWFRAGRKA